MIKENKADLESMIRMYGKKRVLETIEEITKPLISFPLTKAHDFEKRPIILDNNNKPFVFVYSDNDDYKYKVSDYILEALNNYHKEKNYDFGQPS